MIKPRRTWWWLGLAVVLVALVLDVVYRPERIGIDFHTYVAAAIVGLHDGWQYLYDQPLVALAQKQLVPSQWSQPFLSPPSVAWLVAPLTALPYSVAYGIWAAFTFVAFGLALTWSGASAGISRWVAVVAALTPWWVMHSVNVGQVVPLVAAGVVVAWGLLRRDRDIAAGVALSLIFLKPNTAILVPFVLLIAGRYRAFAAWLAAGAVLFLIAFLLLGAHGLSVYVTQLRAPLPGGADALTLKGALGATGVVAAALRVLIVGMVLATAFRLRGYARPGRAHRNHRFPHRVSVPTRLGPVSPGCGGMDDLGRPPRACLARSAGGRMGPREPVPVPARAQSELKPLALARVHASPGNRGRHLAVLNRRG